MRPATKAESSKTPNFFYFYWPVFLCAWISQLCVDVVLGAGSLVIFSPKIGCSVGNFFKWAKQTGAVGNFQKFRGSIGSRVGCNPGKVTDEKLSVIKSGKWKPFSHHSATSILF
jgi:hypothetical protein